MKKKHLRTSIRTIGGIVALFGIAAMALDYSKMLDWLTCPESRHVEVGFVLLLVGSIVWKLANNVTVQLSADAYKYDGEYDY